MDAADGCDLLGWHSSLALTDWSLQFDRVMLDWISNGDRK